MKHSNLIHIILISGSTVISGIINYFYYPILLKYLSLSEFGIFVSLVSVMNILSIFLVGVSFFLTREYSKNIGEMKKIKELTSGILPILLIAGGLIYLIYIMLIPTIENYLKIDEALPVYLAGLIFPISCVTIVFNSLLRSLKQFRFISITQLITPIVKIVLGFLLVVAGYRAAGALGGLLLSNVFVTGVLGIYVYMILKKVDSESHPKKIKELLGNFDASVTRFIFESSVFTFFMNADVLILKNLLDPETAGIYAGISVIGKFIIFLTMSLETVYYGQIMEHTIKSVPRKLLLEPLLLIIGTIVISVIMMIFLSEFLLSIMRAELVGNGKILILVVIYSGLLSYVSLVAKILIGWGAKYVNRLLFLGAISLIALVYSLGFTNFTNYVLLLILPVSIIAILLSIELGYLYHKRRS